MLILYRILTIIIFFFTPLILIYRLIKKKKKILYVSKKNFVFHPKLEPKVN